MNAQSSYLAWAVRTLAFSLVFSSPLSILRAEFREFTGTTGQTMTAQLVSVSGDQVTLKRENGTTVTTKTTVFSKADQEYIENWHEDRQKSFVPRLSFEVNSGKSNREADDLGGDYWRQTFEFVVSITNDERNFDIENGKGSLIVIGKHVAESDNLEVINRQDFDLNIPAGQTLTFRAKEFESTYIDIDYARSGHKYNGYILIVQNPDGKVIGSESAPDTYARFAANALKLKTGDPCDRMLNNPEATKNDGGGATVTVE
ncbi:MAG: hypothetical protein AAGD22_16435 [Verrucomicrobiota bacterium]